jgi:hypothetical protein
MKLSVVIPNMDLAATFEKAVSILGDLLGRRHNDLSYTTRAIAVDATNVTLTVDCVTRDDTAGSPMYSPSSSNARSSPTNFLIDRDYVRLDGIWCMR